MPIFEVVSGGDRRSLMKRFERKSKHQAISELVDFHLRNCARIEKLETELETERMRLAACGTAALGYFDGCADAYKSASLSDVLRLRGDCDSALAEIAELEKKLAMTSDAASKGDAARHAAGGMEMEIQELKAKLADAQAGRQAGRREQSAYELLRQALKLMPLGTKKRAEWVGRTSDLLCIAQAQHSVPEISGIGRDAEHPRAVVLYLRNEPSDEDMRAIQNFLRAMLAAAPGKEDNA
ncbi:TPA: hypothetical protein ACMFQN_005203 [Pseudomonas aeruginosa]